VLFVALISPLDALGSALFSGHMVQHTVLLLLAAPLIVAGAPLLPMLWALPQGWRYGLRGWRRPRAIARGWQLLTYLPIAWALHTAALWIWHLPSFYQLALRSELAHLAEHACFFGTALLFWWALFRPGVRVYYPICILALFALAIQGALLGALMTFSPTPWYPIYERWVGAWGLTPLEDQQIAGLIMWLVPGLLYVVVASALVVAWLGEGEPKARSLRASDV
jgi:putative membrane protein